MRPSLPASLSIAATSRTTVVEIDRRDVIGTRSRELHQPVAVRRDVLADALEIGQDLCARASGRPRRRAARRRARRRRRPGSGRCCAARGRHRWRACRASRGARRAGAACACARASLRSMRWRRAARPRRRGGATISASLSASSWRISRPSRATTHDALAARRRSSTTGEPVTETGMRSPALVTSHDSSRRRTSPSSMRRRTTVRRPELSSTSSLRDRIPRSSSRE